MNKFIFFVIAVLTASLSFAKINIVTTTTDLAAIAKEVGGENVNVQSIAKGYQDPHSVDAKPSTLLKLKRADLYIQVGLELEVGWAPALLTNARNRKILPGNIGFLDTSHVIEVLEKPTGGIDRSQGDIHPYGNPHYWLKPDNAIKIGDLIYLKLSEMDPKNKPSYEENAKTFKTRLKDKKIEWQRSAESLKGVQVVGYHNTWSYLADFLGFDVVNFIEPKPGIPPSPKHIQSLIQQMKETKIPLILVDPYFVLKLPRKVAGATGAKIVELIPSVGGRTELKTYMDLMDYNIQKLKEAMLPKG